MKLELSKIRVRDRLREDLGDLDGLAASIRDHGLIHPIVIDDEGTLVAGGRRLAACKLLGLHHVEVRRFGELSAAERRVIELEENLHRKDLSAHERSKAVVATAKATEAVIKEERAVSADSAKTREGRPAKRGVAVADIADRAGMKRETVRDAEAHVAIAERYPLLQAPDWTRRAAVKVGKLLDAMPAKDRNRIVGLCEQQRAHAAATEKMVANWAQFDDEARDRLWTLAHSKDEREQTFAVRFLADLSPSQDPRIHDIGEAAQALRRAAERFDGDPRNERLLRIVGLLDDELRDLGNEHATKIENLKGRLAPAAIAATSDTEGETW